MSRRSFAPRRASGFSMIEILVTMVIVAFGLLGLAGFTSRATVMAVEASQRASAAAMLADMGNRMASNKSSAASYVTVGVLGATVQANCPNVTGPASLAARDLCEWNNRLAGAAEAQTSGATSALTFRGCVSQPSASDPVFLVTIAWASTVKGTPPADDCAVDAFGNDAYRRTLRTLVRVAALAA